LSSFDFQRSLALAKSTLVNLQLSGFQWSNCFDWLLWILLNYWICCVLDFVKHDHEHDRQLFKGQGVVFSMQVIMDKYFFPTLWKKNWRRSVLLFSRKTQKLHTLILKIMSLSRRLEDKATLITS